MTQVYDQHRAAFAQVEAFVILKDGERVATVAFKFPRDGAGRLYAYVHWLGLEMVRGGASGGGYDKRSAACANAIDRVPLNTGKPLFLDFACAMAKDDGYSWDRNVADAGFTVLQAV